MYISNSPHIPYIPFIHSFSYTSTLFEKKERGKIPPPASAAKNKIIIEKKKSRMLNILVFIRALLNGAYLLKRNPEAVFLFDIRLL